MIKSWNNRVKSFLVKFSEVPAPASSGSVSSGETSGSELQGVGNIDEYDIIKEGKAEILTPKEDKVFYNPIQQFNRDLSIMAIKSYIELRNEKWMEKQQKREEAKAQKADNEPQSKKRKITGPPKINILEALSATGLRAIRYGHEIPHVNKIVANDLLPEAVKSIDRNINHAKLENVLESHLGDAIKYMASTEEKFNVIDLDPYGTATPFMDLAIQAIEDDGMLLVTCTDAGVLAGSGYPEKCFALYGGNNFGNSFVNGEANHEAGIRLILGMISATAAKYKKSIEPVLSLSIDFYFRLFIRVKTSPIEVKRLSSKTMVVYGCNGCGHKIEQPLGRISGPSKFQYPKLVAGVSSECGFCEGTYTVAGPMWKGPIHDPKFIDRILSINHESDKQVYGTTERIKGMLTVAKSELSDVSFYFNLNHMSSVFKSPPISINEMVKALGNLGYNVSLTHAKKNCIKTNAPWEVVLQINKEWLVLSNREYLCKTKANEGNMSEKTKVKVEQLEADIGSNPNLLKASPGYRILKKLAATPEDMKIDFVTESEVSSSVNKLRNVKMVRYQENPTKNWGPKSRPSSK
jgi:tRNA (guanine26-N2/guanine27-N2)-dimethyltransferase